MAFLLQCFCKLSKLIVNFIVYYNDYYKIRFPNKYVKLENIYFFYSIAAII